MTAKILIVDDSTTDRLIIKNMLQNYETYIACDGIEAMRQIEARPDIDLMILDLNMPNMNGFQVLEAVQSQQEYDHLRTIILTNYDEIDNEIKGLRMGAVDYIRKPIHMESLKARIETHLELLRIQRLFEYRLYEQGLTFDTIFNLAPIGIAIANNMLPEDLSMFPDVRINPTYERITGYTRKELIGKGWAAITHPDDRQEDLDKYKDLMAGIVNTYEMDKRYIRPDGSLVWVHMVVARLQIDEDEQPKHIALIQDITSRKEMENRLRYDSEHDRLTGLRNHYSLQVFLEQILTDSDRQPGALIGINLIEMHVLNATYGFQYTHDLTKKIVDALLQLSDTEHQLFCAYEHQYVFYVSQYHLKEHLISFCRTVEETLSFLLALERIRGGIGVLELADYKQQGVGKLMKSLQIASEYSIDVFDNSRNICFYDDVMENKIMREEEIKKELAQIAADVDSDRLYLQFQPFLDLKTGQVCGFEALARLNSYKFGLVSPLEFIPIAEETKLIIPLGDLILRKALSFLRVLKEHACDNLKISINISAIQLLKESFMPNVMAMIHEVQVDPRHVGLEVTESVFSSNYVFINRVLGQLRDQGLQILIDDFGTGYSSLARERELNATCLKIDKYFVDNLIKHDEGITSDIIAMAHRLGHCVIAEGVEEEAQMQYLKGYKCDMIQGYLISRPLDENAALRFLKESKQYDGL